MEVFSLKVLLKNSITSVGCQFIILVISFITRGIFLRYIGVEILGLSSTLSTLIGALSLADLGFQVAIVYRLYRPLATDSVEEIVDILNIFKMVYRIIGCFILLAGILMLPFIKFFIKDIDITIEVYLIFYLLIINSAISYFLSYKQTLLYADQKNYLVKYIEMIARIFFGTLKIGIIMTTKNYYLYLIASIIETVVINVSVHVICIKIYPYLCKKKIDRTLLFRIITDVRDVFTAKISNYIYSSTDNMVISTVISTVTVGYLVNYTMLISQLKILLNAMLAPIVPYIGQRLSLSSNQKSNLIAFKVYSHVRYICACLVIVPTFVLIDTFIGFSYGEQYVLNRQYLILLVIDFYINIVYAPCYEYNNANGAFKKERNVMLMGAVMNCFTSIVLALKIGLSGVFVGTVITQIFLWITRSIIVFQECFDRDRRELLKYWKKNIYDMVVFIFLCIVAMKLYDQITIRNSIVRFLTGGIITEIAVILLYCLFQRKFWINQWNRGGADGRE